MNTLTKYAGMAFISLSFTTVASIAGDCASKSKVSIMTIATASPAVNHKSLVAIAAGNKDFSTLVAALKATGLVDALNGEGCFNFFVCWRD